MHDQLRARAHAGGGEGIEKRRLRIGFVPLTDCAPIVIAKERGWFRAQGLEVELSREVSWASVRDKVAAGVLDAAQMLAPMTFSTTLGLGGLPTPMCTGLSLDLNGNAITLSRALFERLREIAPEEIARRPRRANALARVISEGRRSGRAPLRFGVVFPASSHDLELRYWLASGGVDPDRDVELRVVAPSLMVECLEDGTLDGYCVGEPWNRLAWARGVGVPVIHKHELWNYSPEKVLGVARPWLDRHPNTHRALLRALLEAGRAIDASEARAEVAHVVAGESHVDAPSWIVGHSLGFGLGAPGGDDAARTYHVFHRNAAAHPWKSHALWILSQMLRWGFIEKPIDLRALVDEVYLPDLHREAAADLGFAAPLCDEKQEGVHTEPWTLSEATAPIAMGPDLFFDRMRFDPRDVVSYLESFAISSMRVRVDELAAVNGEAFART